MRFLFSKSGEMLMEGYITIKELAEKWNLTVRRVQILCAEGRIPGVQKFGRAWVIPKDAERPVDARVKTGEDTNWRKRSK